MKTFWHHLSAAASVLFEIMNKTGLFFLHKLFLPSKSKLNTGKHDFNQTFI